MKNIRKEYRLDNKDKKKDHFFVYSHKKWDVY